MFLRKWKREYHRKYRVKKRFSFFVLCAINLKSYLLRIMKNVLNYFLIIECDLHCYCTIMGENVYAISKLFQIRRDVFVMGVQNYLLSCTHNSSLRTFCNFLITWHSGNVQFDRNKWTISRELTRCSMRQWRTRRWKSHAYSTYLQRMTKRTHNIHCNSITQCIGFIVCTVVFFLLFRMFIKVKRMKQLKSYTIKSQRSTTHHNVRNVKNANTERMKKKEKKWW